MDEIEAGIKKFHELVKGLDAAVQAVVPVKSTNSMFLISLTKGPNRKFITIPEDDIIVTLPVPVQRNYAFQTRIGEFLLSNFDGELKFRSTT